MATSKQVQAAVDRFIGLGPKLWLRPGDHVVVARSDGLYDHHGIVVPRNHTSGWQPNTFLPSLTSSKPDPRGLAVLHFVKGPASSGRLTRTSIADFVADSSELQVALHPDTGSYSPEESVHRAVAFEGREDYSLLAGNCEHFSTWCATGHWSSTQVRSAGTGAALILSTMNLMVGLAAALIASGMSEHEAHGCNECTNAHCCRAPHEWRHPTDGRSDDFDNLVTRVEAAERDASGLVVLADGTVMDLVLDMPRFHVASPSRGPTRQRR